MSESSVGVSRDRSLRFGGSASMAMRHLGITVDLHPSHDQNRGLPATPFQRAMSINCVRRRLM